MKKPKLSAIKIVRIEGVPAHIEASAYFDSMHYTGRGTTKKEALVNLYEDVYSTIDYWKMMSSLNKELLQKVLKKMN